MKQADVTQLFGYPGLVCLGQSGPCYQTLLFQVACGIVLLVHAGTDLVLHEEQRQIFHFLYDFYCCVVYIARMVRL